MYGRNESGEEREHYMILDEARPGICHIAYDTLWC